MIKIAIASDHAGFELKSKLRDYLKDKGYSVTDLGTDSDKSVDYPEYANKLCSYLLKGECEKGVLICGTGLGMSIAANRHKGIRAALCTIPEYAKLSREHNNANVLCLGARFIPFEQATVILDTFLSTDFEGDRHQRRIDLLDK